MKVQKDNFFWLHLKRENFKELWSKYKLIFTIQHEMIQVEAFIWKTKKKIEVQ